MGLSQSRGEKGAESQFRTSVCQGQGWAVPDVRDVRAVMCFLCPRHADGRASRRRRFSPHMSTMRCLCANLISSTRFSRVRHWPGGGQVNVSRRVAVDQRPAGKACINGAWPCGRPTVQQPQRGRPLAKLPERRPNDIPHHQSLPHALHVCLQAAPPAAEARAPLPFPPRTLPHPWGCRG
jgi:hypothetical protein